MKQGWDHKRSSFQDLQKSAQQPTLSAGQSGIGCQRSVDVARPAHLGAVIAAKPRDKDMIRDATIAGLVVAHTTSYDSYCSLLGHPR